MIYKPEDDLGSTSLIKRCQAPFRGTGRMTMDRIQHTNVFKRLTSRLTRKLANKLVLIFSGSISVFIVALILVSYFRTTTIVRNEYITNNSNTLSLINQNMSDYIRQTDDFTLTPRKDIRVLNYLMEDDYSFAKDSYLQDSIRNMFNVRQDIISIQIGRAHV